MKKNLTLIFCLMIHIPVSFAMLDLNMTPDSFKQMPKYMMDALNKACKSGTALMCLPQKCMDGDLDACKKYSSTASSAIENQKKMSKTEAIKKREALFTAATEEELAQYENLKTNCQRTRKKDDCELEKNLFTQLTLKSIKKNCDSGDQPSCAAYEDLKNKFDQTQINNVQKNEVFTKQQAQRAESQSKIRILERNGDINQLKSICLNGDRFACIAVDNLNRKIDSKNIIVAKKEAQVKYYNENTGVNRALEIIKTISENGVTVDDISHNENQIIMIGSSKNYKAIGEFLKKLKLAQEKEYKHLGNSKPWTPNYIPYTKTSKMGFKIQFNKHSKTNR